MASDIRRELRKQIQRDARRTFDLAIAQTQLDWDTAPSSPKGEPGTVPLRDGNLRRGLRFYNRSVTSAVLRVTVTVRATNGGFDYANFLDKARRVQIKPKRAKALRWFSAGQPVFAASVDYENQWTGWWDGWWDETGRGGGRWFSALETQSRGVF